MLLLLLPPPLLLHSKKHLCYEIAGRKVGPISTVGEV
jgi:hypothetical protein